jgi:fermentation-respiration switch protein FrsA (DUF1100 family)
VVLVSTPGRPVVDSLSDQLLADAPTPLDGQAAVSQLQSAAALLAAGSPLPDPSQGAPDLRTVLTTDQQSFLKTLFSLDPAALARAVQLPTLVVQGAKDPGVSAADTQALAGALGAQAQVLTEPGASHTLTITVTAPVRAGPTTTLSGMEEFMTNAGSFVTRDGAALSDITSWLSSHLTGR